MAVIGIDLGTTNCAVAYINPRGIAEILQNPEGDNITPSVVQFDGASIIVGKEAKHSFVVSPDETVAFAKRYMDRPDTLGFSYNGKAYSAIDISATILKKLKEGAEKKLNTTITEAVITVPAYFDDVAKNATKQAAEIAGLKVLRLIMEPSAAALYYSYMNENKLENKRVLVYDLGGGTFDVSVVDINGGNVNVIATDGDPKLGGKDFDEALISYIKKQIENELPGEIDWEDQEIIAELYEKSEDIKRSLSQKESVKMKFKFTKKFNQEITRNQFEEVISHLISSTINLVSGTINQIKDDKKIDEVLLVGGSTKMPIVERIIEQEVGIKPLSTVNPDEVVAQGAALLATNVALDESKDSAEIKKSLPENVIKSLKQIKIQDIVPHSLGFIYSHLGKSYNKIVIKHGTKIPAKSERISEFAFQPGQKTMITTITQGDSEDANLVEIIAEAELVRPDDYPINQSLVLEEEYSYDENGLIQGKIIVAGKEYIIKVESQYTLNNDTIKMKQNELSKMNVE